MDLVILLSAIILPVILVLFLPLKGAWLYEYRSPTKRFDEADAVLSRRLLSPGTVAYDSYYSSRPDLKEADDRSRQAPGLLSPGSKYQDPATFAAARANFQLIDALGNLIYNRIPYQNISAQIPVRGLIPPDPTKITRFISEWMKRTGAHSLGYTTLKDYHLYSLKGRGEYAGQPIDKWHKNAIAITVEMDYEMMQSAPLGTSVMESSEQYLRSGVLALKLAAFIRDMGYEARAHIDGNYELICPLVAVDAGLGVIGRMGLLMTPDLGPRVRISVVTTNMPVIHSPSQPDRTTIHFCHLCKKCAENCPAGAIPSGPQVKHQDTPRWQINSEKCYHFWTVSGTDCGRCLTVCPYSHRDNSFHRFIRWGIKNNLVFRYMAVKLDHIFYGRKPSIRPMPGWTEMNV